MNSINTALNELRGFLPDNFEGRIGGEEAFRSHQVNSPVKTHT